MRFRLRELVAGELDHELIWLCVSVAATAATLAWLSLQLPWPRCTFRALTGWPCVTCGATRAALALARGEFVTAWHFNPLATTVLGGLAVFDVYAATVLASGQRRLRIVSTKRSVRRAFVVLACALFFLNWLYLLRAS